MKQSITLVLLSLFASTSLATPVITDFGLKDLHSFEKYRNQVKSGKVKSKKLVVKDTFQNLKLGASDTKLKHRRKTREAFSDSVKSESTRSEADEQSEPDRSLHSNLVPVRNKVHKNLVAEPLEYHVGEPVLTDTVKVYFIWYGNWEGQSKIITILENLMMHLDETKWYQMMKAYYYQMDYDYRKKFVNGKLSFQKSIFDKEYSFGKTLAHGHVAKIVQTKIESNELPYEYSAVYFVLTSEDVTESMNSMSKFGSDYCGYHLSSTVGLDPFKKFFYSFIGHPGRVIDICGARNGESPNHDRAVDAMASSMAHELVEAVSDPWASGGARAWEDAWGLENGDKCAYRFGKTLSTDSNQKYNMIAGDYKYLIQQNWDIRKQGCSMGDDSLE